LTVHGCCVEVAERHVSIRRYRPDPIPEEDLLAILRAGQRAPTDATLHLWTAVRVADREKRAMIAEAIRQPHVAEAAEFLVFLADLYRLGRLLEYRGEELGDVDCALLIFAAIDAGIAAENMALAAESMGYGTCFIGAVQNAPDLIIDLLRLPPKTLPLFGLTIGVPAEAPPPRPRLPLDMLVHTDEYRDYTSEQLARAYQVMAPYSRRRDWLRLLRRYAARGGYFEERNRQLPQILAMQGFRGCTGSAGSSSGTG